MAVRTLANYNPHAQHIIGNEWVPIRQANYQPDEITERGYQFHLDNTTIIVSGSNSISAVPSAPSSSKMLLNAIYPAGTEDDSGPVRQVIIPVDGISVTGVTISGGVSDLLTPADDNFVTFGAISAFGQGIGLSFDVGSFSNELSGKRILNAELLYVISGEPSDLAFMRVDIARASNSNPSSGAFFPYQQGLEGAPLDVPTTRVASIQFKDLNPFWNNALQPSQTDEFFPWRYTELALLDTSATPLNVKLQVSMVWVANTAAITPMFLGYAALRVTYCEENRILYGALEQTELANVPGVHRHRFLNTNFAHAATGLAAGDYVLTSTFRSLTTAVNFTAIGDDATTPPTLYALRQLYELPTLPGVQLNTTQTVNAEFTKESTDILPQTMMYTQAAIVTGSHAYGGQIQAPVYGAITATQTVNAVPLGSPNPNRFTWVRYYARRFGDASGVLRIRTTTSSLFADITSTEFDALPEIVDGWKEITLVMQPNAFTSGSTALTWVWEALGASASSQWQVLGSDGPSLAGTLASGNASYATVGSSGGTVNTLTWKAPNQTVATNDTNSDATLMFSAAAPSVTGFAFTTCTIAVTGIGNDCADRPPGCIPTHILGTGMTWTVDAQTDTFTRSVVNGWGTADTGQSWSVIEGPASSFSVNGLQGSIIVTGAGAMSTATLTPALTYADVSISSDMLTVVTALTTELSMGLVGRAADINNLYFGQIRLNTSGLVELRLFRKNAGVFTNMITSPPGTVFSYVPNEYLRGTLDIVGSQITLTVTNSFGQMLSVTAVDSSITAAGAAGVSVSRFSGNTNTRNEFLYDNFCAVPHALKGGSIEIQRADTVDENFQTIALLPPCITSMCDFEARAGVVSTYRIRSLNELGFQGAWVTGSALLASPAVSGIGDGNSVLVFTSNQDVNASLAYVMNWEGEPIEQFNFPEAGFQQLRTQYGRDFFIAFRPNERGGEQFSRTILVQAAAITPESLADFRSLRDLAWQDLPYVCVRDELGNRWFANVAVPTGRVRNNRTLYLTEVNITEVTDTPAPYTGA